MPNISVVYMKAQILGYVKTADGRVTGGKWKSIIVTIAKPIIL
ncbi:MAG: hypothetical protein WCA39_03745 [Nitrososphaeraceae archaeon]